MRSFITGLVVVLLSTTISTTAFAGDALLWEQEPTQAQMWNNLGKLLDNDSAIFGDEHTSTFEPIVVDEPRGVYAMPGQEELGVVLADYIASKNKPLEKVDASFGSEPKCEDEQGDLTVDCEDMDSTDLGFMPASTIASL